MITDWNKPNNKESKAARRKAGQQPVHKPASKSGSKLDQTPKRKPLKAERENVSKQTSRPIGGFMSLQLGSMTQGHSEQSLKLMPWANSALRYGSAGSAMWALLQAMRPSLVWLPYYTCNEVLNLLSDVGVKTRFYALKPNFAVDLPEAPKADELVIINQYFGLNSAQVRLDIASIGAERCLLDASQALYAPALTHTVYSPRKFLAMPDGGFLVSQLPITPAPLAPDAPSMQHSEHLLLRALGMQAQAYAAYQKAEASIVRNQIIGMSEFSWRLCLQNDFAAIGSIRRRNFRWLQAALAGRYPTLAMLADHEVPLCLPVIAKHADKLRKKLIDEQIFCAKYWPNITLPSAKSERLPNQGFLKLLLHQTLFLPCDQRLSETELQRIVEVLVH